MTEDQAKIAAIKFAIKMTQEARLATIEECAKVAENCDTLGPSYQDHELTPQGLHARKKVRQIAESIRSLSQPKPGKE